MALKVEQHGTTALWPAAPNSPLTANFLHFIAQTVYTIVSIILLLGTPPRCSKAHAG